ncbi:MULTISPECIES: hypothetical protein [unclassified Sutcliffiella]|uniref:hypothetical protein n=1 Tax=unclassified Sutcliffiella TaxID=2837532 RepID=UPI0030D03584
MYKKWIALGFIGILLIGGGFVVKGMQYDTPALKDSFTRNFIIQEEQAPEGFHVFESKIGTYKMLFPSDFQLDNEPDAYGRQGDFFELWNGYVDLEGKDSLGLKGTYQEVEDGQVETRLEILKTDRDKEQDFEIYEHDNLIIFFGKSVEKYDALKNKMIQGSTGEAANVYYGFVADKMSNQILELDYSIVCPDGCSINESEEIKFMKTLMESVEFNANLREES